jgi:hypothetical protein
MSNQAMSEWMEANGLARPWIDVSNPALVAAFDRNYPHLDEGIRFAVQVLKVHGVETCESCEGGEGHAFPEPTVVFTGGAGAGWEALSVAMAYGLPVLALRQTWPFYDGHPNGPYWELTFRSQVPRGCAADRKAGQE